MRIAMLLILLVFGCGSITVTDAQVKIPPKGDEDEVVKIETTLIDIPLTITDKSGKPILNLNAADFVIYEDGKKQEIADFSTTTAPFEIALLLDTSGSTRGDLRLIQRAASNFIASLRSGDRVSIVAFRTGTRDGKTAAASDLLTTATNDRNTLNKALDRMNKSNGTPYYDGLLSIAERVFRDKPADQFRGRRAIVALTDGVDSSSEADFEEVKKVLEASGVALYFVKVDTREFFEQELFGDCETSVRFSQAQLRRYYRVFFPRSKIEKVTDFCELGDFERLDISKNLYNLADSEMQTLANNSGGKVFPATNLSDTRLAFTEISTELGTKYSLSYYPTNQNRDGRHRKITVELKNDAKGVQIRAREGYTAPVN